MRKYIVVLLICLYCSKAESAIIPAAAAGSHTITPQAPVLSTFDLSTVKIKTLEKLLGRKLKFKEKIAVKVYQWKIKKGVAFRKEETKGDKGKTAMILGIVSIATLFIPYANIASLPCAILAIIFGNQARKVNPKDSKAMTGVILGWVTIGIIILAIALLIILLSSWTWGWG
ncbi:MAG: hypothetical protein ABIR30_14660 [Chitinophagaceae bacterium]